MFNDQRAWINQKAGIRKFIQWLEDTQEKTSWDLVELEQLHQDFVNEQESDEDID